MKKSFNLLAIVCLLSSISSCSKDHNDPILKPLEISKLAGLPGQTPGTLNSSPVVYSNGVYTTGYAGGLNFGDNFPHPTNKYDWPQFTPWTGLGPYPSVTGNANLLEFNMNGHRFVALLGTPPGGLNLTFNSTKYWQDYDNNILKPIQNYLTTTGGSPSGIIEIKGKFLISYSAPLGVAIFDIDAPEGSGGLPTIE